MYFFRRTLRIRCILGRSRQWKPHRFVQTILLSYVVLYDNTRGVTRIGTEVLKVPATCKTGDRRDCAPYTCGYMRARRPRTRHARGSIILHFALGVGDHLSPSTCNLPPFTFNVQLSTRNLPPATFNSPLPYPGGTRATSAIPDRCARHARFRQSAHGCHYRTDARSDRYGRRLCSAAQPGCNRHGSQAPHAATACRRVD